MKAHIEWAWAMDAMNVFLFERGPGAAMYYTVGDDGRLVAHGFKPEEADIAQPALVIHRDALDTILRASAEKLPPSDVAADALKDARATRDRLLTLVEHTVTGFRP